MEFLTMMFRSDYDRAALVAMAIGLAINLVVDWSRRNRRPPG